MRTKRAVRVEVMGEVAERLRAEARRCGQSMMGDWMRRKLEDLAHDLDVEATLLDLRQPAPHVYRDDDVDEIEPFV